MSEITLYAAEQLIRAGYPINLLREGTKVHAFKNPRPMDPVSLRFQFRRRAFNIGIALGDGLMVADCDSEEAIRYADEHGIVSPMVARTRRGEHRYFQTAKEMTNQIQFRVKLDVLFHGHAVAPPSVVDSHCYEWRRGIVSRKDLPMFPQQLIVEPQPEPIRCVTFPRSKNIRSPEGYCMKIQSVQGQAGSRALCRAVSILRDCGRSSVEAFSFLLKTWNPVCATPEWSEAEIRRAVERMYSKGAKV